MKKTTISILLSLLCVSFVYSQKNTIKWGTINKSVKGLYENDKSLYELLDMDNEHYYLSKSNYKSTKVKLLCFDNKTHQLVRKTALNLSYQRKKTKLHQFFETEKGKFTYQSFYKKDNMHFITSRLNNLKLEDTKEVFKYPYDNSNSLNYKHPIIYLDSDVNFNKKHVFVSPNKKYVGFIKNRSKSAEDKNEKIAICLFDSDMNKIWSRLEEVKHLDDRTILKDFVVDNNGVIGCGFNLMYKFEL